MSHRTTGDVPFCIDGGTIHIAMANMGSRISTLSVEFQNVCSLGMRDHKWELKSSLRHSGFFVELL